MKMYLKRDKSAGDSAFVVFDELGKEAFYVIVRRHGFVLTDRDENILLKIRRLSVPAIRAYSFSANGRSVKLFQDSATGSGWHYYGSSWKLREGADCFEIIDADNSLVADCKLSFGKRCYELEVIGESNLLFSVATAVCLNLSIKADKPAPLTV